MIFGKCRAKKSHNNNGWLSINKIETEGEAVMMKIQNNGLSFYCSCTGMTKSASEVNNKLPKRFIPQTNNFQFRHKILKVELLKLYFKQNCVYFEPIDLDL